jgi:ATP-citrate lyase alpha-subunit
MFTQRSKAVIYGKHTDVVLRMLDYDFLSGRDVSVVAMIDPASTGGGLVKVFFWGSEILIPTYPSVGDLPTDIQCDTFLNFASFRSASEATWQALRSERFDHIVIIAEGIPEREIREIITYNESLANPKRIIWPATAGAIAAGVLRMGNSGGSLENIITSRLYRAGSVGFVSRSGGMSNEMFRVISTRTDGIHTGIALGGDRFVCSTFRDIVLDYESNPEIRMIVMLGEVGSRDELEIVELLKAKKITKPIVAYVSGSFAEVLGKEVQFGHAGAKANADEETASYKNQSLREAGAYVPSSYMDFGDLIASVWLSHFGAVFPVSTEERENIASRLKIIQHRRSTHFTSTISDERGEELQYNGKPVSDHVSEWSLARVIGSLWLKRDLPLYAVDFLNTILILLADHGPAVAGATNTIITARAGKDILSSLISGLLTIGPRFGGAIDGAARTWYEAVKNGESPEALIARMKKSGTPIQWIGHKVKSKFNPDARCTILQEKASSIPSRVYLDYALAVESFTLEKKSNLILNVDGHIAAILIDIFVAIGMPEDEIEMYLDAGIGNAFFILARSIGFIGHALDQKRLGEWLYRTPWEDILYTE